MAAQKIHSRIESQHHVSRSRGGRHNTLEVRYQTLPTKDSPVPNENERKQKNHTRRYSEFLDDVIETPRMGAIRCSVRYICFGACLVFVGSILLCAFGFTIILPYRATKHWPEVTCNVTNSSYSDSTCSCNQVVPESGFQHTDCTIKYPCLQIFVQYLDTNKAAAQSKKSPEPVYKTAFLYRSWADSFYNACSIHECGDEQWNIKESQRFRKKWGQPSWTYPCFFDPRDPNRVIVQRTPVDIMIHAIFWPTLALVCGAVIWMGLCFGCCRIEAEASNPPTYGLL